MKKFEWTQKQKKWALTATLLAVLGFNLSAPIHDGMQSIDLASESGEEQEQTDDVKTSTLISADGKSEVTVKYQREGDKTLAIIKGSIEGIACDAGDCLTSKVLNVPFESSAVDLEKALRSSVKETASRPRPPRDEEEEEVSREEEIADASEAALGRVAAACERKEEGRAKASCLTDKFIAALKRKSPKIDPDAALEFFNEEIRGELVASMTGQELSDISFDSAIMGRRSKTDSSTAIRGAELLRKLQSKLPREYSDVRKAAKDAAVEVVNHYSAAAKQAANEQSRLQSQARQYGQQADQLMQQANATPDWNQKNALMQQANQLRNLQNSLGQQAFDLTTKVSSSATQLENVLVQGLAQQQYAGLADALSSNLVDKSFANSLLNDYQAKAAQALANPTIPNITIDPLNPTPNVPGIGQQMPVGNGMGSISGGSLGNTPTPLPFQGSQPNIYQRQGVRF